MTGTPMLDPEAERHTLVMKTRAKQKKMEVPEHLAAAISAAILPISLPGQKKRNIIFQLLILNYIRRVYDLYSSLQILTGSPVLFNALC